jgi:cytochrome c553
MRNLSPAELRWRPDRPRPVGQSYEYPVEAMRHVAEGERKNNADMANIMKAMSSAERRRWRVCISGS